MIYRGFPRAQLKLRSQLSIRPHCSFLSLATRMVQLAVSITLSSYCQPLSFTVWTTWSSQLRTVIRCPPSSARAPQEEVGLPADLVCVCSPYQPCYLGMACYRCLGGSGKGPSILVCTIPQGQSFCSLGWFLGPFTLLPAAVAICQGWWAGWKWRVAAQTGQKRLIDILPGSCLSADGEGDRGAAFCRKPQLQFKCEVWEGQPGAWTWARSWAPLCLCTVSDDPVCHLSADAPWPLFWPPHLHVPLPARQSTLISKGRSN